MVICFAATGRWCCHELAKRWAAPGDIADISNWFTQANVKLAPNGASFATFSTTLPKLWTSLAIERTSLAHFSLRHCQFCTNKRPFRKLLPLSTYALQTAIRKVIHFTGASTKRLLNSRSGQWDSERLICIILFHRASRITQQNQLIYILLMSGNIMSVWWKRKKKRKNGTCKCRNSDSFSPQSFLALHKRAHISCETGEKWRQRCCLPCIQRLNSGTNTEVHYKSFRFHFYIYFNISKKKKKKKTQGSTSTNQLSFGCSCFNIWVSSQLEQLCEAALPGFYKINSHAIKYFVLKEIQVLNKQDAKKKKVKSKKKKKVQSAAECDSPHFILLK